MTLELTSAIRSIPFAESATHAQSKEETFSSIIPLDLIKVISKSVNFFDKNLISLTCRTCKIIFDQEKLTVCGQLFKDAKIKLDNDLAVLSSKVSLLDISQSVANMTNIKSGMGFSQLLNILSGKEANNQKPAELATKVLTLTDYTRMDKTCAQELVFYIGELSTKSFYRTHAMMSHLAITYAQIANLTKAIHYNNSAKQLDGKIGMVDVEIFLTSLVLNIDNAANIIQGVSSGLIQNINKRQIKRLNLSFNSMQMGTILQALMKISLKPEFLYGCILSDNLDLACTCLKSPKVMNDYRYWHLYRPFIQKIKFEKDYTSDLLIVKNFFEAFNLQDYSVRGQILILNVLQEFGDFKEVYVNRALEHFNKLMHDIEQNVVITEELIDGINILIKMLKIYAFQKEEIGKQFEKASKQVISAIEKRVLGTVVDSRQERSIELLSKINVKLVKVLISINPDKFVSVLGSCLTLPHSSIFSLLANRSLSKIINFERGSILTQKIISFQKAL